MMITTEQVLNLTYSTLIAGRDLLPSEERRKLWESVTEEALTGALDTDLDSVFIALSDALSPTEALHIVLGIEVERETKDLRKALASAQTMTQRFRALYEAERRKAQETRQECSRMLIFNQEVEKLRAKV